MSGNSTNQALRQIRALYALGPVGGLTDAALVERFLARGVDGEDAFAALVERHGPMVLRVCRRMLPGPADADDAFQAVFLILARKAGSIRRLEALKSWLYGVAVRTAKEARRRSARRRAREERAMDELDAGQLSADERSAELLALLDEEIDRLPARFREALMLCELEGVSRKEAARQLGLAEGTLSSRLSRGRALLRDRLTRRGVALGAGLFLPVLPEPSTAPLPEPLADTTVRLALTFAAGGMVRASVSSLAEGVLAMMSLAKLKLVVIAAAALLATAGLAWAVGARVGEPAREARPKSPAVEARSPAAKDDLIQPQFELRGVVIDEAGRPVEGVEVLANAFNSRQLRGVTGADGSFAIRFQRQNRVGLSLLARTADRRRSGTFRYDSRLFDAASRPPARIVLKPAREVVVRVADASPAPVPGAAVEVAGQLGILDDTTTGPDGTATLLVAADGMVEWIIALKPERGFDFAEFGPIDQQGRSLGGVKAGDLPASVALTLERGRTVRIKAVDSAGKPLEGIAFYPWLLHKEGRRSTVNVASRHFVATTGPDGVVSFDWVPPVKSPYQLYFFPITEGYAHRRVVVGEAETGTVTATMSRTEAIRGRVVHTDGKPAVDIQVGASGSGKGMDDGHGQTRTGADGSYEMQVNAGEAYAVYVDEKEWAAPSRLDVVVREGKPVEGVDFALTRGTVIRGTVTVGPDGRPAANQYMRLIESAGRAPDEVREAGDRRWRAVERQFGVRTDETGQYSIRVGPGTYTLVGPPRVGEEKVTIKDEAELVRDYRMPRPDKGPISGQVVTGPEGKGVAGARVEIYSTNMLAVPVWGDTDAQGRFALERSLDRSYLHAKSLDGSLGAIVEIGALESEVTVPIAPTAAASGVMLDVDGQPASNRKLDWGRRIYLNEGNTISSLAFAPTVVTDAQGRFTLPALVVGQEYSISLERDGVFRMAGVVRPEEPGALDLGTLRAGAYRPRDSADSEEASSFRKDAPGAGTDAPPIEATTLAGKPLSLADFRGKHVLLDFWATWCGPCLAEIPQLQAVFDAFGKDERFAILSLSVDEEIKEPKDFQEKRKLPWTQAFLGNGIHGATPGSFGVRAIPALVLVGPDGKIVARGMRGDAIMREVAKALGKSPAAPVER